MKNVLFCFIVYVRSPHRETFVFKNTKIVFFSLLVFVRSFASCDTCFQVIQKYKKV